MQSEVPRQRTQRRLLKVGYKTFFTGIIVDDIERTLKEKEERKSEINEKNKNDNRHPDDITSAAPHGVFSDRREYP